MLNIRENVELSAYTIFKIGGPAKYFCETASSDEVIEAIRWAQKKVTPFFILGAGSNVLASDKGFNGLIIKNKSSKIMINGLKIAAEAGAQMARVAAESVKAGFSGFEWAIGIPGTIGGSVRGNAGCFGSEMKDVVESAEVFNSENVSSFRLDALECRFSYRHSIFKENPNLIVLSATLKLRPGDPKKSQGLIAEYAKKRSESQDIGAKCAGCVFKNVEWSRADINKSELIKKFPELKQFSNSSNIPAGFLIDSVGLKGRRIGGAKISEKHANFFINDGGASAEEMIMLMSLAKNKVQGRYGIFLEEEIQLLF